ncbi:MAG: PotD/PotF family extracellular solute-binding protein [Actinomycetota bacterium]
MGKGSRSRVASGGAVETRRVGIVAAALFAGLIGAMLVAGPAAVAQDTPALRPDKGTVTILTWEGYHDPALLEAYSAETGVQVSQITAGSVDEMFARALAAPGEIDLVYFDAGNVVRYRDAGLLTALDPAMVPNTANIAAGLPWEEALSLDGDIYGLPYNWGTQPLMWNIEAFPEAPTSWKVLWDPAYAGKVTIPDDSYIGIPMIALAQGIDDPYQLDDAGFATVREALSGLRPNLRTLTTGFNDAQNLYATGDVVVGYLQNVAVANALNADGVRFAYGYPEEGTPFWIDGSMMLTGGNRQEVYDFIDHTLDVPWQAAFIPATGNAGILDYATAAANVDADVLADTEVGNLSDPDFWAAMSPMVAPNRFDERIALWNEFKAGA